MNHGFYDNAVLGKRQGIARVSWSSKHLQFFFPFIIIAKLLTNTCLNNRNQKTVRNF